MWGLESLAVERDPKSAAGWNELAALLSTLAQEDIVRFSRYTSLNVSGGPEDISRTLLAYAARNPEATPSTLLATTGSQAAFARDLDFAREMGMRALNLAGTPDDEQLAHVSLAQTYFQNRRDKDSLAAFVEHCRAAIDLGHAGTFCYERLATLYEYRGEIEEAARISRRAVKVLEASGDTRSAVRFQKRLGRLARSHPG